jgi:hypothetical protein
MLVASSGACRTTPARRGGDVDAGAAAGADLDAGIGAGATTVVLRVDGREVATVPVASLASPRLVDTLLPEAYRDLEKWHEVTVDGSGGRTGYVRRPAQHKVADRLWLGLGAGGRPELRRQPPSSGRADVVAEPILVLADVTGIDVTLGERAAPETRPHAVTVTGAGALDSLAQDQLGDAARLPAPIKGTSGQPGWDLWALVRAAAGRRRPVSLTLIDAAPDAKPVVVDAATLARKDHLLHLRWNRRGQARVRLWVLDEPPRMLLEISDLAEVRADAAPAKPR